MFLLCVGLPEGLSSVRLLRRRHFVNLPPLAWSAAPSVPVFLFSCHAIRERRHGFHG